MARRRKLRGKDDGKAAATVARESGGEDRMGKRRQKDKEKEKEKEKAVEVEEGEGEEDKVVVRKFFKVFIPTQSGERLRIPSSFKQCLQNEPTGMVSLKGHQSGNTWHVELASESNELFFVNGWKEFIRDHSIVFGDFLVFCYDGLSQFSVVVFDCSGSEKLSAFHAQPCMSVVVKTEHDEGDMNMNASSPVEHDEVEMDMNAASPIEILALPVEESNETTRKRIREMDDLMETVSSLKNSCDVLGKKRRNKSSLGTSKAVSTRIKNTKGFSSNPSDENVSGDKTARIAPILLRMSTEVPRRGKSIMKGQRQPAVISQRRQVTEEEKNQVLQKAKRFKSKNPFTVQIMMASYVYVGFFMNIPCEFVREYLPRTSKKLTLWDPQGKAWEVNYVYYSDRCVGSFSGGWGKFAIGNNLEKFDVCIFELFMKDNLKVHIYRVVPEITPYLLSPSKK